VAVGALCPQRCVVPAPVTGVEKGGAFWWCYPLLLASCTAPLSASLRYREAESREATALGMRALKQRHWGCELCRAPCGGGAWRGPKPATIRGHRTRGSIFSPLHSFPGFEVCVWLRDTRLASQAASGSGGWGAAGAAESKPNPAVHIAHCSPFDCRQLAARSCIILACFKAICNGTDRKSSPQNTPVTLQIGLVYSMPLIWLCWSEVFAWLLHAAYHRQSGLIAPMPALLFPLA
jgi:hypothetical protein